MKKTYIISVAILLIVGGLVYLGQKEPANTDSIKIGAVISLTGPAASFGEHAKNGMQLAVDEINEDGGIEGRKVEIIYEDDGTDPKNAVSAFKKLTAIDGVQGIVGGLWDFVATPLYPLALETQTAFISPSNFRIEGGFEPNKQSFVMLPEFKNVLVKSEEFLKRDDVKKVAVVHFKSVFGEEIAKSFDGMTNKLGKGPMIDEAYAEIGTNDFKTIIAKLKSDNVDTVFLDTVDIDTVSFLRRSKELGFTPKFITYVGSYDAFTEENKSLLEGVTILDWEFSKPAFAEKYKKAYGVYPAKSAQRSYDAVYVLAESIAKTQSTADVASYIESHSFKTPNDTIKFRDTHEVESIDVELKTYSRGNLVPLR